MTNDTELPHFCVIAQPPPSKPVFVSIKTPSISCYALYSKIIILTPVGDCLGQPLKTFRTPDVCVCCFSWATAAKAPPAKQKHLRQQKKKHPRPEKTAPDANRKHLRPNKNTCGKQKNTHLRPDREEPEAKRKHLRLHRYTCGQTKATGAA